MAEKTAKQAQQTSDFFRNAVSDHFDRVAGVYEELGNIEDKGIKRANEAVEEMAHLAKESLSYVTKLNAQWRQMTLDAMQKTAEMWAPKA